MKCTGIFQHNAIRPIRVIRDMVTLSRVLQHPGNLLRISPTPGTILSTEMMHNILNTAYKLTGRVDMTITQ